MKNRFFYTFVGLFIGLQIPLGWLLFRAFSARRSWWMSWVHTELHKNSEIYIVLALTAVSLFAFLGFLIGQHHDENEQFSRSVEDSNFELSEMAARDGLTGLLNARAIRERLDIELENAYQSPLTCLLIDIDHFKKINDRYGHPFGDRVLTTVSVILTRMVRKVDAVGRLGGEEFIVVLPDTSRERGREIAERIRSAVMAENFSFEKKSFRVTVSAGVVTYPSDTLKNRENLLKAVDEALYKAKREGRNRVTAWSPESSDS